MSRYGAMSSFSRFTPILPDSVPVDTIEHEATVTIRPLRRAYGKAQQFNTVQAVLRLASRTAHHRIPKGR